MKVYKQPWLPFTQVNNDVLNDPTISFKAKWLYAYILSKPDGRDFANDRIWNDSTDGERSVASGVNELIASWRMERKKMPSWRLEIQINWQKWAKEPERQNGGLASITTHWNNEKKQLSEEEKQRVANFKKSQSVKKPVKARKIPSDYRDRIVLLWQHRNSLEVYYEQIPTADMQTIAHARLLEYDIEEIKKSMDNYAKIYKSENTYRKHKRSFHEFMSRKNGMPVFRNKTEKDYDKKTFEKWNKKPDNGVYEDKQHTFDGVDKSQVLSSDEM